ncbi:hypothetical protein C7H85_13085 [Zobellella endophytica]|uniref:Transcriptional regulator AbiEi antitoxin N-terminal domain-containing protein n=1 Tax=Zobellella endophytica TaxID=2116700 RepID=A0A2P7R3U1_9GAMM|nr:type IV toxin-antitoxin system AbiEi family antitoxin [Zobellella endophytica]PSJ44889.1 hypothetical protein C7H85_13085 [Zobellella endophytica]
MSYKLNWLVNHASPGSLVLQPWLTEHGIGYSLAQRYVASGWLKKLRAGVYYRPAPGNGLKPGWVEALNAVTHQLNLPVYLAGLSSLGQQGLSHYLQLGRADVWVGAARPSLLPKWFREFDGHGWRYCTNSKLAATTDKDFTTMLLNGKEVRASAPELAAYEVVDSIGKHISFEHTAILFQGLTNLSPRKIQSILHRSRAVQTNRIFLFLGHYYAHQWSRRLDESQIELGSGKRQVVENGKLDERYLITVPSSLAGRHKENE